MTTGDNYITLRWLNTLGGWDYWTFAARHTYGYDISNVQTFNKDIFSNWDVDFRGGKVERETLSLDANSTITLRSGFLTKDQINAVAQVKIAIAVETVVGTGIEPDQQVNIDRSSFTYRTDKEKQIEFEFGITLPTIQIQTA